MTFAYWCVLIAGVLPIVTVFVAKLESGYDNRDPRAWLEQQHGMRRRADYAHRNHFESFPFFAAGVIIAHQLHAQQNLIDILSAIFVAVRIIYTIAYLADRPNLRSAAFIMGYGCVLALFFVAAYYAGT